MESEEKKKAYNEYVERITPNNSLTKDMWNAFWIGGLICVMGQIWLELFMYFGMDKEDSASYTTLILILESAILTGLNVYPKIAKKGGAGCLVPITGFANGVVSPAIEFKAEGHIFGIGAKIFYHSRTGYSLWYFFKLDSWNYLFDFEGDRDSLTGC